GPVPGAIAAEPGAPPPPRGPPTRRRWSPRTRGTADEPPGPTAGRGLPGPVRAAAGAADLSAGVRRGEAGQQPRQPAVAAGRIQRRPGQHPGPRRADGARQEPPDERAAEVHPRVPPARAERPDHRLLLVRVRPERPG